MKQNKELGKQFIKAIENQIKANNPPETKLTLDRLIESGFSKEDAKCMIARCLAVEFYDVIKSQTPFDEDRYTQNLKLLPEEPVSYYDSNSATDNK